MLVSQQSGRRFRDFEAINGRQWMQMTTDARHTDHCIANQVDEPPHECRTEKGRVTRR